MLAAHRKDVTSLVRNKKGKVSPDIPHSVHRLGLSKEQGEGDPGEAAAEAEEES
jgi:hypothetical protein